MKQSIKILSLVTLFTLVGVCLSYAAPAREDTLRAPSTRAPATTDKTKTDSQTYGAGALGGGLSPSSVYKRPLCKKFTYQGDKVSTHTKPDSPNTYCPEGYNCGKELNTCEWKFGATQVIYEDDPYCGYFSPELNCKWITGL